MSRVQLKKNKHTRITPFLIVRSQPDLCSVILCRVISSGLDSCCFNYYKDGLQCKGINT